jgi:hypothetical protein
MAAVTIASPPTRWALEAFSLKGKRQWQSMHGVDPLLRSEKAKLHLHDPNAPYLRMTWHGDMGMRALGMIICESFVFDGTASVV